MFWDYDTVEERYIRVKREIHSPFWRALHNCVAHPMLTIYRPWGEWLHEYTAKKMYEGEQSLEEVEEEVTAVTD